jgi:hypothetical protein
MYILPFLHSHRLKRLSPIQYSPGGSRSVSSSLYIIVTSTTAAVPFRSRHLFIDPSHVSGWTDDLRQDFCTPQAAWSSIKKLHY